MDVGMLRGVGDLVLMIAFVALCAWAYSPAQRARFEEDGRLPFHDEPDDVPEERSGQ